MIIVGIAMHSNYMTRQIADIKRIRNFLLEVTKGLSAGTVEPAEIENIKPLFLSTIDQLESDVNTPVFDNFTPWNTRYHVEMASINDAVGLCPL
jgi:hypothetical protein